MAEAADHDHQADHNTIPTIVLSNKVLLLKGESAAEWKSLTSKLREACEKYGCFVVEYYDEISVEQQRQLFETLKEMFDLPLEKKSQYTKSKPNQGGYTPCSPFLPLYESFGLYGDEEVRHFHNLMWPPHDGGKPEFCEAIISMNEKMRALNLLLLRMIFESFGIGDYYKSKAMDENVKNYCRASKYKVPPPPAANATTTSSSKINGKEDKGGLGLLTHIDRSIFTILCQNSVQGFEALTKQGNWISLTIPTGALIVVVGDALQVWSNGRFDPVKHRVVMRGGDNYKERYSCGFFMLPKDGVSLEVPQELVDEEHPLLYRPFVYSEYYEKHITDFSFDALKVYAGVGVGAGGIATPSPDV